MEVVVNANTVIGIAGFVTAIGVLVGVAKSWIKQLEKWNGYDEKIAEVDTSIQTLKADINEQTQILRDEQYMQTRVLFAVLDGLHQLHCNGEVTKASSELNDYLNRTTHRKS